MGHLSSSSLSARLVSWCEPLGQSLKEDRLQSWKCLWEFGTVRCKSPYCPVGLFTYKIEDFMTSGLLCTSFRFPFVLRRTSLTGGCTAHAPKLLCTNCACLGGWKVSLNKGWSISANLKNRFWSYKCLSLQISRRNVLSLAGSCGKSSEGGQIFFLKVRDHSCSGGC